MFQSHSFLLASCFEMSNNKDQHASEDRDTDDDLDLVNL